MTQEQVRAAHIVKNIDAIKTEKQAKKEILEIYNKPLMELIYESQSSGFEFVSCI